MPTAGSVKSIFLCPVDVSSTTLTGLIFSLLALNSIVLVRVACHTWTISERIIRKGVEINVSDPFLREPRNA
jgi:hypothetical protein